MMVPLVTTREEVDYHSEEEQSDDEALGEYSLPKMQN